MNFKENEETTKLRDELRHLNLRTRQQGVFALPESVDYALNDQRFWDVQKLLQQRCDELRAELLEDTSAGPRLCDDPRFNEYVWLQGPLVEWQLMELKFITAGVEFMLT